MSVEAMAWAFRTEIESPTLKFVLVAIANYANDKTGVAWPSQARLSRDTALSERSVARSIQELAELGFLKIGRQSTQAGRKPNILTLNFAYPNSARPNGPTGNLPQSQVAQPATLATCHSGMLLSVDPPVADMSQPATLSIRNLPQSQVASKEEPSLREPSKEEQEKKEKEKETREDALCLLSSDFDTFWLIYPNKTKRLAAEKAFAKIQTIPNFVLADLMDGLKTYVAKTDDRPWCNPDTWLKEHRWTDKPATVERTNGKPGWFERVRQSAAADEERLRALGLSENRSGSRAIPDQPIYPRLSRSRP